ncbi:hypothetical protein Nos7524_5514 [Nostoc sp. PCC 7524]|nr:hypothetical protein Nos7524_5514 [Nostoc sp. PCC 7524]
MSYYDFNNHFWSAETVCACSSRPKQKSDHKSKIGWSLYIICIAISIPLLIDILVGQTNQNSVQNVRRNNVIGNCLMLESSMKVQMYCNSN